MSEENSLSNSVQAKDDWAKREQSRLTQVAEYVLQRCREKGASGSEVGASIQSGLSVDIRMGEIETLEFSRDRGVSVAVYFGQRKGTASSGDLAQESIDATIEAACAIAKHTEEDPYTTLADPAELATDFRDLDIWHPWALDPTAAIDQAKAMEQVALDFDPLIQNSEGASVSAGESVSILANSQGFLGRRKSTRASRSCVVLASDEHGMERDYWFDTRRSHQDLQSGEAIGREAARRAVARHNPQGLTTRKTPVLFTPQTSKTLLAHLSSALSGGNLYRQSSFLLNAIGEQLFPESVYICERPYLERGLRSVCFDNDGVAPLERNIIDAGVLTGYVLGVYSAKRLGLQSTGNAGGVHNLTLNPGSSNLQQLMQSMGDGLLVTELMGQGVNLVTGDYSRGASGFWVENGQIAFPVAGITIAGNLRQMFQSIQAVGSDTDDRSAIISPSLLLGEMTVAGQ